MILRGVVLTLLLFALVQVNALSLEDVLLPGCKYGMQGYAPPNFNLCEWSHYLQFIILVFFMILGIGAVGTIILVVFYVLRKFGRCGNQFPTTSYTLTGKRLFSAVYVTFSLLVVFACFSGIVFSIMYAAGAGMLITTAFNVVKDTVNTIQSGATTLSSTSALVDAFAGNFNGMSTGVAQAKAASYRAESDLTWLKNIYGNMSSYSGQTDFKTIINTVITNNQNMQTLTTNTGFTFNSSNPLSIFPLDMNSRYPLQGSLDSLNRGLVDQPTDNAVDDKYGMPHGKAIAAVLTQTQANRAALDAASTLTEGTIRDVVNVYVNFRNSVNKTAGASFQLGNLQDYITSGNVEGGYRALLAFFAIFFILGFLGVGIAYVVFTVFGILRSGRATKVGACCSFSLVFWAFVYAAACLFIFMIFSPYCSYKTEIFDPNRLTTDFQAQYPNYTSALNFTYGLMKCQGQTTILDVMSRITNGPPLTQQSAQFFTAINESIRIAKPLPNSAQYSWDTYSGVLVNETIYSLYMGQQDLSTKFGQLQTLFGTVPTTTPAPPPTTAAPNASSTTPLPTTTLAPQSHNLTSMQELLQQVNDYGNYYPYFDVHIWDNWAIEITSYTRNLSLNNGTTLNLSFVRTNVSSISYYDEAITKVSDATIKQRLQDLRNYVVNDKPKYDKVTQFQADFGVQYRALNSSVVGVTLFANIFMQAASAVNTYAVALNGDLNALNLGVKQIAAVQTPLQQNAAGLYNFINQLSTAKCSNIGDSMNVVNYEICTVMNTALVFVGLSSFLVGLFCFILYPIALMAAKRFTGNTVDDDIDSLHRRADALAQRTTGKLRLRM